MNQIKHQFLSQHAYSAIALPRLEAKHLDINAPITLVQRDESTVVVMYVDHFEFNINDLPPLLTKLLFGLTTDQLRHALRERYKSLGALAADKQVIYFIGVQKL